MMNKLGNVAWFEIAMCALLGGCISAAGAILFRLNFDRNALLTLLGALAGVALVVIISQGESERQISRAKRREADQINTFLAVLQGTINSHAKPLHATPLDESKAHVACLFLVTAIEQTKSYAEQVAQFANHLDFHTRALISSLIFDCDVSLVTIRKAIQANDELGGNPNWSDARSRAVLMQNAIELVKSSGMN